MAKTTDIAERTLQQEKQKFTKACHFFQCISTIFKAMISVCVVVLMACALMAACGVGGLEELDSWRWLVIVFACIVLSGFAVALNFGAAVFRTLKSSETPFRYDVADKIKAAGITLTVTGAVAALLNGLTYLLSLQDTELFADIGGFPDITSICFGLVLMALAYVFNYGCKLQRESDETL